jgi:signal transduction histidine kinase
MSEPVLDVTPRAAAGAMLRGGVLHDRLDTTPEDAALAMAPLARAWRYVVLIPLVYRIASFPKVFIGYATANGGTGLVPVLAVTTVAVLLNLIGGFLVLRRRGLRAAGARRVLWLDLGIGVLLNFAVATTVPAAVQPFAVDVSWTWLVGTFGLWASLLGVPGTLWLLLAAIPLRALLTLAGGLPLTDPLAVTRSIGCLVGLVVAVLTMAGFLVLSGAGGRFAVLAGIRHGTRIERDRNRRLLHDTVLQTLDALAITPPAPETDPAARLAEVRDVLGGEAAALRRRIMETPPEHGSRGFVAELGDLVTEMAGHGLRTQLVAADFDDQVLSAARRTALRDAVREALRNAAKHAGTNQIVLRVEDRDGGISAVVRDHGVGFDPAVRPPGFGIRESITARLAEVGGRSSIDSAPGAGTRVTLWVPA